MEKKKILIDVDQVICEPGFLYLVNQFLGTSYKIEDFTEYYIDDVIGSKEKQEEFYQYYQQHNDYDYAKLLPDAYEVMEELSKTYDLYICSACVNPFFMKESGKQFMDKYNYLVNTFPFLDPNKFIFTNAKNLLRADVQVDDRLCNLEGDVSLKLLFASYHNKTISKEELEKKQVVWVEGWKEIKQLLLLEKEN